MNRFCLKQGQLPTSNPPVASPLSASSSTWFLVEIKFGNFAFEVRENPDYPKKKLSEQRSEQTTISTHTWRWRRNLNLGQIGGPGKASDLKAAPPYP